MAKSLHVAKLRVRLNPCVKNYTGLDINPLEVSACFCYSNEDKYTGFPCVRIFELLVTGEHKTHSSAALLTLATEINEDNSSALVPEYMPITTGPGRCGGKNGDHTRFTLSFFSDN